MIQGFFFDLDGTLVDTHRANFEAYRRALAEFNVEITYEQFKKTIGHQAQTYLPWLAPGLASKEYKKIAERKAVHYQDVMHLTAANKSLLQFLNAIRPNHVVALVTTAKRENANAVLLHYGLADIFDVVVASDDVYASKPSPECYQLALKKVGLEAKEVIAFEDSSPGAAAAEAAGIAVVRIERFAQ